MLAKQSFEKQSSRNIQIADTMDSFFDNNKIYIKSVQHEATMRHRKPSNSSSDSDEAAYNSHSVALDGGEDDSLNK